MNNSKINSAMLGIVEDKANYRKNSIKTCISREYPEFKYHRYSPSYGAEGLPVLVAVHGISHRAKEQVRAFKEYAERYGFVIIAPLFCRKNFPAYQRLGITKQEVPFYSDIALNSILKEVSEQTGALTEKVYLFGYSAGGQFVHRYAMAYPEKVHAVVVGAAGWYTFPDLKVPFPRGLGKKSLSRTLELSCSKFLKIPMATFVGEHDNQSDIALKRSRYLDLQQGITRIERARNWIAAMRYAAEKYGFDTEYKNYVMESCGHSFTDCVDYGQLAFKTMNFLLETTRRRSILFTTSSQTENYRVA
ncbi:MAG: alpha/beta fold hydrolase [Methylococcales bacterium]